MANPPDSGVQQNIDNAIVDTNGGQPLVPTVAAPSTETYRMDPKTKVPVSKYEGNVWKGRRDAGTKGMESLLLGWEEAEYYYDNAQQNHRSQTGGNKAGNRNYGKDRRDAFSMTENVVYATVNAVVPNTYAKNPNVEVTMTDEQLEPVGVMLKHLANRLAEMKYAPGINLKSKMRKSIVRCEITNEAWLLVGWTKREDSADQARDDIMRIGKELADAKDAKEIERLEGELLALEESCDLLDPPGPYVKTLMSKQVITDAGDEDDFSDCKWKMVGVMFATNYLNARFRVKNDKDQYTSAYAATHVVDAVSGNQNASATQEQIDTFKLFSPTQDNPKDYGYEDKNSYERAKRTKVWLCFDKVKRRFYMYSDKDFTWPIWVYDDPYHFPDFYPLVRMSYHSSPTATRTRGEVSHYLDQQDEINTIVDELNRARISLRDNTIFNSRVLSSKDVEDIILNSNKKLKGVAVPDGQKLEDLIMGPPMPNLKFEHLWRKDDAKAAVNMISGVGDAMRGEQYKTNTTNQAISEYSSISGVRLDEKRDAIEDCIGEVMWKVLFLCLQFMDEEMVRELTGSQFKDVSWQQMQPDQIRKLVQCRVEGGSTQKPTSAAKKQEALQVGQILGQFASASPYVVILLLKVFERAFDGIVITDQDIKMLMQSIMMQLQQGAPPLAAGGASEQQPNNDNPPQAQGQANG